MFSVRTSACLNLGIKAAPFSSNLAPSPGLRGSLDQLFGVSIEPTTTQSRLKSPRKKVSGRWNYARAI